MDYVFINLSIKDEIMTKQTEQYKGIDGSIIPENKCNEFPHEVIALVTFDEEGQATIRLKTNFGMNAGDKIPLKNSHRAFMKIVGTENCGTGPKNGHTII